MLELQIQMLTMWWHVRETTVDRLRQARDDERGDVTAQTALIMLLVVAAIGAGIVISTKIKNNADNIPEP